MIQELRGVIVDVSAASDGLRFPAVAAHCQRYAVLGGPTETVYGYAHAAATLVHTPSGHAADGEESHVYEIRPGQYFCAPGRAAVWSESALIVSRVAYRGLFAVGGPVEPKGRLKYIDGCSDTLLLSPPKLGDPCLNYLYFPPGIAQTMHTHPSARVGMVVRGAGECVTPAGRTPLRAGMAWHLPAGAEHCFHTSGGVPMAVVAWHPTSDVGPTDESHPMITQTFVAGVSADKLDAIRTTEIT